MSIKLVVTDIDGTLLPEGTDKINPAMFEAILQLKEKGIVFAGASGRQFHSMETLFEPVKKDMIFIAENGAYIHCRGVDIQEWVMSRKQVVRLVEQLRKVPGGCITLNAKDAFYVEHEDLKFLDLISNGYHNLVYQVDDVLAVDTEVIKVSLYMEKGIEEMAKEIVPQWEDTFTCAIAGDIWLDFMHAKANKGNALKSVQKTLSILSEETMAFGDNLNDIAMLQCAGESYAVGNARKEVKAVAKHVADTNVNDGVLKVIRTLLETE